MVIRNKILMNAFKSIKTTYLIFFVLFFLICIGLGYPTLNRYAFSSLGALSDSLLYFDIVKNGLDGVVFDPYGRSTRILVPMMAHFIYNILPSSFGSWDLASFSMLIVTSFFCSLTAIITLYLGASISKNIYVGVIASLLYLLNFSIVNFYLAGLVDSAQAFSFAILCYVLFKKKWSWLPLIAFFGTLAKEVFLPLGSIFVFGWILFDFFSNKSINKRCLINAFIFIAISFATVTFLKSYVLNELIFPWRQFSDSTGVREYTVFVFVRFFYVFSWLLPLAIPSVYKLPKNWLSALAFSTVLIFLLGYWVGISGAGYGRGVFNIAGPAFCIAAAITLDALVRRIRYSI